MNNNVGAWPSGCFNVALPSRRRSGLKPALQSEGIVFMVSMRGDCVHCRGVAVHLEYRSHSGTLRCRGYRNKRFPDSGGEATVGHLTGSFLRRDENATNIYSHQAVEVVERELVERRDDREPGVVHQHSFSNQKRAANSTALRLAAASASSLEVGLARVGSTKISWMFVNPMKPRICLR